MNKSNYKLLRQELAKRLKSKGLKAMRWFGQLTGLGLVGAKSEAQTSTGSKSSNIVQSIRDLPLTKFIDCYIKKDFSVLGTGTPEELEEAWKRIISQYCEAKEDGGVKTQMDLELKMELLKNRAKWIACSFTALEIRYTESLAVVIRDVCLQMGHDRPFTKYTYVEDMRYIGNRERHKELDMMNYKNAYAELEKKAEKNKGQKPTENGFYESLIAYNQHFKTSFTIPNLNTLEFALMMKSYAKSQKIALEQSRKHGRPNK